MSYDSVVRPKLSTRQLKNKISCFFSFSSYACSTCMFMMTTVLVLLQTTIWSWLRGRGWTLLMCTSPPVVPPSDLKVCAQSVVLVFHTFTVPSDEALRGRNTVRLQITTSVADPDPHGSGIFAWIQIRNNSFGSGSRKNERADQ